MPATDAKETELARKQHGRRSELLSAKVRTSRPGSAAPTKTCPSATVGTVNFTASPELVATGILLRIVQFGRQVGSAIGVQDSALTDRCRLWMIQTIPLVVPLDETRTVSDQGN